MHDDSMGDDPSADRIVDEHQPPTGAIE